MQPQRKTESLESPAFESLVRRQSRFAFRVAYAMLRNSHDAEDVVQDTFMSLYRSVAWRQIEDERAFLARATWRQAVDRLRANAKHNSGEPGVLAELPSRDAGPEEAILNADAQANVHRLIDALPEELRQPLALASVQELNSREIAAILGVPEGSVRTRLKRARHMLKQKLAAQIEVRYAD